ncbi:hypothetical protein BC832DRAFT_595618 [Gaertneriomyces semiglobifer]|nr:hypothetical protein BC832DRAFT_595618 [Gaertneriomyces semiglobifer]
MGAGKKKGAETVSTQSWIPLSGRNDASRKKCGALVDLDADEKCNANATYLVGEKSWFCDDHDPFKKERLDPAPPPEGAPLEAQDSEGAPKTLWIQLSHKLNKAETEAFKREMDKAQKRIEKCHGFQESQKRCPYKSCYSVGDFWYCANHDPFKGLRPGSAPSPQPSPTDSPRPPKKNKTDSASASKPASPVSIGSSSLGITNRSSTTTTSISIAPNTRPFLEPSNIATEERENHSSQLQGSSTLVSPAASTSVATISTCEGPLPGRDGPAAPLLTQDHVETALQEPSDDNTTNFKSSNLTPDDQQPHHTGADPQLLASQTFHCPHVAITVTTTHITEKEHSVEPAANASAKRSVLDLIMSTFSPAAADPTDENPPTSDGYYFIAICALTGLLIGFIIFCVQKDVEPLAIASVFGTIIGAEGLLLKIEAVPARRCSAVSSFGFSSHHSPSL